MPRGASEITVENPDRAALVALYNATDGPNWLNSENWLTGAPLGEWFGVDTDREGRVVTLAMSYWDPQTEQWISNGVSGPIPPELGNLANLEHLYLHENDLTGPIPTELGRLTDLESLSLESNDLSGPIPPELGELASLTWLSLRSNDLTGPIPRSLLDLARLTRFYFRGHEGLCAPGVAGFADWLGAMEDTSGPYCNESDMGVLNLLYETSGGPHWTNSSRWIETPALDEWYGVTADALGRVVTLDLSRNGLAGEMPNWPPGALAQMTELRIGDNAGFAGRLPLSLADLSLRVLHYAGTELCAPAGATFARWLNAVSSHQGTGVECAPQSDREILEILYDVTGGPDWTHNENWLTDAPLGDWHGVEVDDQGRVVALRFFANRLIGRIPRELGGLANLQTLELHRNRLTGPIPSELGNLANLGRLYLHENDLTAAPSRPSWASSRNCDA